MNVETPQYVNHEAVHLALSMCAGCDVRYAMRRPFLRGRYVYATGSEFSHRLVLTFQSGEDFLEFVYVALNAREGDKCICRVDPLRGCPKHPTSPYAETNAPAIVQS